MPVTLSTRDLKLKWGFSDGELLGDHMLDRFGLALFDDDSDIPDDHAVLVALVHRYLLPVIPNCPAVHEVCSCHNPIRFVDPQPDMNDTFITVSDEQIDAMINELMTDAKR